jgi:hypothetical protein
VVNPSNWKSFQRLTTDRAATSETYGAENASLTPSKRPIRSEVVRLGADDPMLGWPMGGEGTKANPQTGDAAEAAARAQAAVTVFFIFFLKKQSVKTW